MKKAFFAITFLCALTFGFTSCKPELKNVRGQVKSFEVERDTLRSMVITVGDEEKIVTLLDARFQNGVALQGDSVILDYIDGKDNTLRALAVTVLPKPAQEFVPSDTLVTVDSKANADSIQ